MEISYQEVENAILQTTTMSGAAKKLRIDHRIFKRLALSYGLYNPVHKNQFGSYELKDILEGKYPQYPTHKLSKRLVKEGYKKYECEKCHVVDWNGEHLTLEMNHKDGDNSNHRLENLELLCPNCHSQTPTFKNKKRQIASLCNG